MIWTRFCETNSAGWPARRKEITRAAGTPAGGSSIRRRRTWVFGLWATLFCANALATPMWVQDNEADPQWNVVSQTIAFTEPQTAGNLNYVAIGWIGAHTILSVTDTQGNTYVPATTVVTGPATYQQVIFYAKNIAASASNSVTVAFDSPVRNLDIRIAEYTGLSTTNPFDVAVSGTGTGTNTDSGSLTTTNANDFLVASNKVDDYTTGPGAGYSQELLTYDGDILEFRAVSATGTYNATAPQGNPNPWIMQLVAFRDAGSPAGGDSTPPSAPTGLSATNTSGTPINLSWTASTDNVGVTAYLVDRCMGASCSNFSPVAIPSGTAFSDDTGLVASRSYTYRVRAIDAAGNVSSAVTATATSPAITFVQQNSGDPQGTANSVTVPFTSAQNAGDLNVVAVASTDATTHVASITDTIGNTYVLAVGPTSNGVDAQSIYYAKNIQAAAAGANAVTVTFDTAVTYPDVRILEYSGLDTSAPLDQTSVGTGSGYTASAGPVTTAAAKEVIVASVYFNSAGSGAGSGYSLRVLSTPDTDLVEDQMVSSAGSYSATAAAANDDYWVMSITTFKAAVAMGGPSTIQYTYDSVGRLKSAAYNNGENITYTYDPAGNRTQTQSSVDTTAPNRPTGLSGTVVSIHQINLTWTKATDTQSGVQYYTVYRGGTAIATSQTNSYSDMGVTSSSVYTYTVTATDYANHESSPSDPTASLHTPDVTPPSIPQNVAASAAAWNQVNVSWTASHDDPGGAGLAGYHVYRGGSLLGTSTTNSYADTTTAGSTSYTYTVDAYDSAVPTNVSMQSAASSPVTTPPPPDTTAPTVPTNLGGTAVSAGHINLTWTASTDTGLCNRVVGYRIYRNGTQIGTSSSASYSDTGLSEVTTYTYKVDAYDCVPNYSGQSSTVSITTPTAVPNVPSGVTGPTNHQAVNGAYTILWNSETVEGSTLSYYIVLETNVATGGTLTYQVNVPSTSIHFSNRFNVDFDYQVQACTVRGSCSAFSTPAFEVTSCSQSGICQ